MVEAGEEELRRWMLPALRPVQVGVGGMARREVEEELPSHRPPLLPRPNRQGVEEQRELQQVESAATLLEQEEAQER